MHHKPKRGGRDQVAADRDQRIADDDACYEQRDTADDGLRGGEAIDAVHEVVELVTSATHTNASGS